MQSQIGRVSIGLAAGALSGLLIILAWPPFGGDRWGWLGWVAPLPILRWLLSLRDLSVAVSRRDRFLAAAAAGFTLGSVQVLGLATWFAEFTPLGYPLAAVVRGALCALWAPVALLLLCRRRLPDWLLLAAWWTLMEWWFSLGACRFPWGTLAPTQFRYLPVIQVVEWVGAYGLSFSMAATAAIVAPIFSSRVPPGTWRLLAATAVLQGLVILGGARILATAEERFTGTALRVGLIQSSQSLPVPGAAVQCISPPEEYAAHTRKLVADGVRFVVWPEGTSQGDPAADRSAFYWYQNLLIPPGGWPDGSGPDSGGIIGSFFLEDRRLQTTTRSAVGIPAAGNDLTRYDKVLIVPFGEYLPFRPLLSWSGADRLLPVDLTPGRSWAPLRSGPIRAGVSVCFESGFGYVSTGAVRQGANLLVLQTSDGWAGRESAGYQHAAFAPLRAVEQRRWAIRAAATGVSQILDPTGRVVCSLPMFSKGTLDWVVRLRDEKTTYARWGDWPLLVSLVVVGLGSSLRRKEGGNENE